MTIRLTGLPDQVDAALARLRQVFDVLAVSDPYPCRGRDARVRVYVEVRTP